MSAPVFGHIAGHPVGTCFENRTELAKAGVHRHTQAGIAGTAREGADSIVLSGGYEDDQDFGDEIVYTGYGGRDPVTKRQVSDQPFDSWNYALARSSLDGHPVRVIRGEGHPSPSSPHSGYRYDGLFMVEDYWHETGRSGFRIWRYRLRKLPNQEINEDTEHSGTQGPDAPSKAAPTRLTNVLRIVETPSRHDGSRSSMTTGARCAGSG